MPLFEVYPLSLKKSADPKNVGEEKSEIADILPSFKTQ